MAGCRLRRPAHEGEILVNDVRVHDVAQLRQAADIAMMDLHREIGLGLVERGPIEDQVAEVDKVKRSESGMIVEPVTLGPNDLVADALAVMERYHISGVPITDENNRLVGILHGCLAHRLAYQEGVAWPASTPPVLDPDGRAIPGSLNELSTVDLGGTEQTIMIDSLISGVL